jgi:Tfp pilus assembly protein PilF
MEQRFLRRRSARSLLERGPISCCDAKDPAVVNLPYDLGVLYQLRLHDKVQAGTSYKRALEVDFTFQPALNNLAVLETSSDPTQAVALYNKLLKLNPNDAEVLLNLGRIFVAHGQSQQGQAHVERAVPVDPALATRPPGATP